MFHYDAHIPGHTPPPVGCNPHLHGKYPPEKKRYTITEEVEFTARQMRETIDRLLKFEERLKIEADDLNRHLTADNVIFKQTMNDAHQTFLQAVQNEINSFEAGVDATVTLFQQTMENNYSELSEEVKAEIKGNLDELNKIVDDFEKEYGTAFEEYKTEIMEAFENYKETIDSRLEANDTNTNQAVKDFELSFNVRLDNIEQDLNSRFTTFTETLNATVNNFKVVWGGMVEDRLDAQDAKIADAENYMKTNLNVSIENMLYEMEEAGELVGVIDSELYANVKKFGAVGDGVTDDTIQIQQAIANAEGKILYFPSGEYLVSEELLIDYDNAEICISAGATIRCVQNTVTGGVIQCIGHFSTLGTSTATEPKRSGLHIYGGGTVISENSLNNAIGFGRYDNVVIENITAHSLRKGITGQYGGENITVRNCTIYGDVVGALTFETTIDNIVVDKCVITADGENIRCINAVAVNNLTVQNCTLTSANGRNIRINEVEDFNLINCNLETEKDMNIEITESCNNINIRHCELNGASSYGVSASKISKGHFNDNVINAPTAFYLNAPAGILHINNNECTGVVANVFGAGSVAPIAFGNVGSKFEGYAPQIGENVLSETT